jgi:amidase
MELTGWCSAIGAVLLPVVVVPFGRTPGGLPVGGQLIGPSFGDRRLLSAAAAISEVLGGFEAPPGC